jgi:hypothetical protein
VKNASPRHAAHALVGIVICMLACMSQKLAEQSEEQGAVGGAQRHMFPPVDIDIRSIKADALLPRQQDRHIWRVPA